MDIYSQSQYFNQDYNLRNHSVQISITDSPIDDSNEIQYDQPQENKACIIQKGPAKISKGITKLNYSVLQSNKNKDANQKMKQADIQEKIYTIINPNKLIQLFPGCYVTDDGIIRFCYSISTLVFGYQKTGASQFRQDNNLGVVDIELQSNIIIEKKPIHEALQYIYNIPDQTYHEIAQQLYQYEENMQYFLQYMDQINITEELLTQKDNEYYQYCNDCYSFLKQYKQDNPFTMIQYGVRRFNLRKREFEYNRAGYSQAYLQLLGLDSSSFGTMLLRRKEVDLLTNKFETLNLSLCGINTINNQLKNETYVSHIKTFDGFPLKLYQTKRDFIIPSQMNKPSNVFNEYTFYLTEFDIDVKDLQNLIKYRKKINNLKNKNLSIDEFIEKELSYQFQDLEYSVISQCFVDKYYSQNIKQLSEFEQNYIKSKQCHYRHINQK